MSLDTKAIRARADAATAGPWGSLVQRVPDGEPWIEVLAERRLVCEAATTMDQKLTPHDAANFEFIAAARTDVPALCAEIDRLRAARREFALKCLYLWDYGDVNAEVPTPLREQMLRTIDAALEGGGE